MIKSYSSHLNALNFDHGKLYKDFSSSQVNVLYACEIDKKSKKAIKEVSQKLGYKTTLFESCIHIGGFDPYSLIQPIFTGLVFIVGKEFIGEIIKNFSKDLYLEKIRKIFFSGANLEKINYSIFKLEKDRYGTSVEYYFKREDLNGGEEFKKMLHDMAEDFESRQDNTKELSERLFWDKNKWKKI